MSYVFRRVCFAECEMQSVLARDESAGERRNDKAGGRNASWRRGSDNGERDEDYDNAEVTAVQQGRAAVTTERGGGANEAEVRTTVTVKVARTGTQRRKY